MVGRGADERQTQRHVNAALEVQRLDRDQRLIVIHAHGGVIARAGGGVKHRVGGQRAAHVDPLGAQGVERGRDDRDLLAPHGAAFARVRVQPGDRDARRGQREVAAQGGGEDADRRDDRRAAQAARRLGQRDADGDRDDLQLRPRQQHHRALHAAQMGEKLGVAGKGEARALAQRLLVDRVRHHRRRRARLRQRHRARDRRDHRRRVGGVGRAGAGGLGQTLGQHGQGVGKHGFRLRGVFDLRDRGAQRGEARGVVDGEEQRRACAPRRDRDLPADTGGVAHGQRQRRRHRSSTTASARSS